MVSAARDEVETIFACPRSDGFDLGCSFFAARLNQLGERWKLVEPTCERQRAGRVETVVQVSGDLWSGLVTGCRVVSTQPFAGAHVLAQPASGRGVHVLAQPA